MKATILKIIAGLIMTWPFVTCVILAVDAMHIFNTGQDWDQWLGIRQFFPVVFPILLALSALVPMAVSILKRSVSAKSFPTWQWIVILFAPLVMPVFWYLFVWKTDRYAEFQRPEK